MMAYKPVDRSFTDDYLYKQHKAMRWLAAQGIKPEEIRDFTLGNVDEDTRCVVVTRKSYKAAYYSGLGRVWVDEWEDKLQISVRGSGNEWFFLKSKFKSSYMFTKKNPRSWRKEIAREDLYSLSEIKKICASEVTSINRSNLTFTDDFATIKVLNLNVKKSIRKVGDKD